MDDILKFELGVMMFHATNRNHYQEIEKTGYNIISNFNGMIDALGIKAKDLEELKDGFKIVAMQYYDEKDIDFAFEQAVDMIMICHEKTWL